MKTQLQMRIEYAARTGNSQHPRAYFVDLGDYRSIPFIGEVPLSKLIDEEDVKSGVVMKRFGRLCKQDYLRWNLGMRL